MNGEGSLQTGTEVIKGQFRMGKLHGKCTRVNKNGTRVIGTYSNGGLSGTCNYSNKTGEYKGGMMGNLEHGEGTKKFKEGTVYKG